MKHSGKADTAGNVADFCLQEREGGVAESWKAGCVGARQNTPDLLGECHKALLWNTKPNKVTLPWVMTGCVSEEHCLLVMQPHSHLISDSHAVSSSLSRTRFTTSKGLCGEAMETALCVSCLCIVIPMLLYVGLAHEAFLQCCTKPLLFRMLLLQTAFSEVGLEGKVFCLQGSWMNGQIVTGWRGQFLEFLGTRSLLRSPA